MLKLQNKIQIHRFATFQKVAPNFRLTTLAAKIQAARAKFQTPPDQNRNSDKQFVLGRFVEFLLNACSQRRIHKKGTEICTLRPN